MTVKRFEINAVLEEATRQTLLCRMFLKADPNCYSCFPLKSSEDLFLYMDEQDFRLDGYVVRRMKDIVEINSKVDLTNDILESEGVTSKRSTSTFLPGKECFPTCRITV